MESFLICPACNEKTDAKLSDNKATPFTPDGDWVEGDAKNTCRHCGYVSHVRVQMWVSGELRGFAQVPKPVNPDLVWYAIATVYSGGMVSVKKLYATREEAEATQLGYHDKLLTVTSEGYADAAGRRIEQDSYSFPHISFSSW